jgi:hypothetical protein
MMAVAVDTEPTFRAERPMELFEKPFAMPGVFWAQYDVAPDGERFVMLQDAESHPTEIRVILNWDQELKARVPANPR